METTTKIQPKPQSTSANLAIRISGLSKRYLIGGEKKGSIAETLSGMIGAKNNRKEEFWALKDINFEVNKGEVIGIIGKNGAGKSTLLKILSRITQPTNGKIEINGRVASLLEVGTGFHPELTGRENIYLNGTVLGMSRQEVKNKFEEIVEFSGVRKFIDTPVKHYSSGMYVRLAFAVAAHLEPEILIIDEVLAVGDADFQKKCLGKMKEVAGEGRTVLFVSHNMNAVLTLCDRAILLTNGSLEYSGNVNDTIRHYFNKIDHSNKFSSLKMKGIGSIENVIIKTLDGSERITESNSFEIITKLHIKHPQPENLHLTYHLKNSTGIVIVATGTKHGKIPLQIGENALKWEIPQKLLLEDDYSLDLFIVLNKKNVIFHEPDMMKFNIEAEQKQIGDYLGKNPGLLNLDFNWKIQS